jgi:hypothetical protein
MPRRPGRVRCRIAALLSKELGMEVRPEVIWVQRGIYSHATTDAVKWGAHVPVPGTLGTVPVFSWDTMTDCLRQGFHLRRDDTSGVEVSANG